MGPWISFDPGGRMRAPLGKSKVSLLLEANWFEWHLDMHIPWITAFSAHQRDYPCIKTHKGIKCIMISLASLNFKCAFFFLSLYLLMEKHVLVVLFVTFLLAQINYQNPIQHVQAVLETFRPQTDKYTFKAHHPWYLRLSSETQSLPDGVSLLPSNLWRPPPPPPSLSPSLSSSYTQETLIRSGELQPQWAGGT